MADDRRLFFVLEGPGVKPETVDIATALSLAAEYFDLVRRIATLDDKPFTLTGVWVEAGSARFASMPSSVTRARAASNQLRAYVRGRALPPPKLDAPIGKFRRALEQEAARFGAAFRIGNTHQKLDLAKPSGAERSTAVTSMRARLVRLGGAEPAARFSSKTEPDEFTVTLPNEEIARQLGPHVYREVDIVVRISRDEDGAIESGELIEFEPLQGGDAAAAWREWFKEAGAGWEQVKDVEAELHGD